jgi:ATP-dependent HslUV protease subunit HslV
VNTPNKIHGTTILALRSVQERKAVIAADGQATMNNLIIKSSIRKVRKIYDDKVLVGFAGSTGDKGGGNDLYLYSDF